MARKRKNRTHLKDAAATDATQDGAPKSFVIKHGTVGPSLTQLVRDVRKVMEPNTASRLRERNRNKLKDYLVMAPALHVTHLLAFTLTPKAPSMRIVRLSDGPTLSFRVERYSLMKDILSQSKRSRSIGMEYLSPPLLVLASFPQPGPGIPVHLPLVMKAFQSLFPPLSPKSIKLSSARRVVLVSYNAEKGTIDWRHYVITIKSYGVSRRVRKLLEGPSKAAASTTKMLDLGSERDLADFLLRKKGEPGPEGYESASSAESVAGDENDQVDLADDYVGKNNKKGSRRAVRLDEVGPRMELRLVKITEGVPGKEGGVIYHSLVKKSKKEVNEQKAAHAAKMKLRKERREEQERNIAQKKGKKVAFEEDDKMDEDDEEEEEEEGEDDGAWNDDEEIEDDEEEEDDIADQSSESEDERPPPKKAKTRTKR